VRGTVEPQVDMKEQGFGRKKFSTEYLGTLKQKLIFFKDVRITNSNRYQDDARTKRISQY
jgi:hypothetical protein